MSYEGFTEQLCAAGHYFAQDCMAHEPDACPVCQAPVAFSHGVDQTNGYDPSHPSTCRAAKAIIGIDDDWREDHHGNRYAKQVFRYEPAPGSAWVRLQRRAA